MLIEWFEFVLVVLAAYRITRFFVEDSLIGMGTTETVVSVAGKNREVVHVPNSPLAEKIFNFAYHEDGSDKGFFRARFGDLVGCSFCLGFWISCTVLALWTQSPPWTNPNPTTWVITAFAVAGGQAFISSRANA